MNLIEVTRKQLNTKEYKRRYAVEGDAETLIKEDTLLVEDGKPILLYKKIDWCDTTEMREACKQVKYTTDTRLPKKDSQGITTRSAIFGYRPRIPLRQDFCSSTMMATNQPHEHQTITQFAEQLTNIYKEYFPIVYEAHMVKVQKIRPEWVIPNTLFTSGIINYNNTLQYHHDSGNFKGVLSNMVAFRDGVIGGRLVLPEYNIKLEIADNTITIFDGQSIVHGVTPIKSYQEKAYRFTAVYYSLENMWNCDGIKDEVERIRKLKKTREHKRLQSNTIQHNKK
jgi:hypothetical protein